jgi:arylsulfatase A-like enzyme
VSEPLLRVPLLVRSPGRPGERRRDVASLLDVHATVLGRLGLRADGEGRDLLAGDAASQDSEVFVGTWGYAAVPQYGLVAEGHRLRWRMGRGAGEALDAVSLEDGSPTDPDAPELAHLVLRLQRRIGSASARSPGPMRELGPDTAAKLRALGYAE